MRRSASIVVGALVLAGAISCFSDRPGATDPTGGPDCTVPGSAIGPNHVVVFVRDFAFRPDTIRIRPGMSVTWVNCEPANIEAHTSTSDDGAWDSGSFGPGTTFTRTFAAAGSFSYFCRPHPFMHAVVLVQ